MDSARSGLRARSRRAEPAEANYARSIADDRLAREADIGGGRDRGEELRLFRLRGLDPLGAVEERDAAGGAAGGPAAKADRSPRLVAEIHEANALLGLDGLGRAGGGLAEVKEDHDPGGAVRPLW